MGRGLRIGEVAEKVGVNVQTLRYYERRGILSEPDGAVSGYREYSVGKHRRPLEDVLGARECSPAIDTGSDGPWCAETEVRLWQRLR